MINGVGEKFDLNKLITAQNITKEVVNNVAKNCFVGMSEADGILLIEQEFKKYGDFKFWHPHKFRVGKNTTKAFKEESDKQIVLNKNDIFFIDVGPIIDDHEGDYGETFVLGNNDHLNKLKKVSYDLFQYGKKEFLEKNISGFKLYEFLEKMANKEGFLLNLNTLGHRVGDFPHHLYYRGKLKDVEVELLPNLWVLEVQISDLNGEYGAFYEDILFGL